MKKIQLMIVIFLFFISTTPVLADDILEQGSYWQSVVEVLNLNVDGSINPILVNMTKDMDYISTITFYVSFTAVDLDWDKFGKGNSTDALVNGTYMIRGDKLEPFLVKTNGDLLGFGRDTTVYKDEKTVGSYHIVVPINYYDFMSPNGLTVVENINVPYIMIGIQDNMPDFVDGFHTLISGKKWVGLEPDFKRDWLEDMFIFDNPLKFPALLFTIPLLMIFTWEPVGIMVGVGILLVELITFRGIWIKITD